MLKWRKEPPRRGECDWAWYRAFQQDATVVRIEWHIPLEEEDNPGCAVFGGQWVYPFNKLNGEWCPIPEPQE